MTYFVQGDGTVRVGRSMADLEREELGGHSFAMSFNRVLNEFELTPRDGLTVPSKVYGDFGDRAHRIIHTFLDRKSNTGVLLTGRKGCGKTLLARMVSKKLSQMDIPTIVIDAPYSGPPFNQFIGNIKEPCMVLIDEFEKIYGAEKKIDVEGWNNDNDAQSVGGGQSGILSLLDGTVGGKKLFMLTTNAYGSVSTFLKGRPGRIFYAYEYDLESEDFIREYCGENLIKKEWTEKVITVAQVYGGLNFDTLQALVEETNRWNQSPIECANHLNLSAEDGHSAGMYDVEMLNSDGSSIRLKDDTAWIDDSPMSACVAVLFDAGSGNESAEVKKKKKSVLTQNQSPVDRLGGMAQVENVNWARICFHNFQYSSQFRCWFSEMASTDRYDTPERVKNQLRIRRKSHHSRSAMRLSIEEGAV